MTQGQLKQGAEVHFTNGTETTEETMHAVAFYQEMIEKYVFELNGQYMVSSHTYAPMLKVAQRLTAKYNMSEV